MIPCTINFTKETFLGRLEVAKFDLKQSRELVKIETKFSALNIKHGPARNTKVGDIASSSKSIEEKIQEWVALLVEREKDGKNIFKCWTCNEYIVIMHLSALKEEKSIRENSSLKDVEIVYMPMKKNLIKTWVKIT